jgi:hypothetical protein
MSETAAAAARGTRLLFGVLEWPERVTPAERRSLWAGGLGWMLDAMDVMLYSMVLAHLMRDLGMDKASGGLLNSLTLLASAIGGLLFGFLADRVGRTRALMLSILVYSLASGACAFSTTIVELAIFRFVLGLGMGGEWTTGAALIAETWPAEHRGKALGPDAVELGDRRDDRGRRRGAGAATLRLARRLPGGRAAGARGALDPPRREGVGDLAAPAGKRAARRRCACCGRRTCAATACWRRR